MRTFYLCRNPFVRMPENCVGAIYCNNKPNFFAMLIRLDVAKPLKGINYAGTNVVFTYLPGNGKAEEFYILIVQNNIGRAAPERLKDALEEAVIWYSAVQTQERPDGEMGEYALLKDYSPLVPGIQIFHFLQTGIHLLSYPAGIQSFASIKEVEDFMVYALQIPSQVAYGNGIVNADS